MDYILEESQDLVWAGMELYATVHLDQNWIPMGL